LSGEQIGILALLVAAFVAGWLARGAAKGVAGAEEAAPEDELLGELAERLGRAHRAYRATVAMWAAEGTGIGDVGRTALRSFERELAELELLGARLAGDDRRAQLEQMLHALSQAAFVVRAYPRGEALDSERRVRLREAEEEFDRARARLGGVA
jgi:hypothetical protein